MKYLLLILTCVSFPVLAADLPELRVDRDNTFPINRLTPSEGMERIIDFEVIGNTIWLLEIGTTDDFKSTSQLTKIELNQDGDQTVIGKRQVIAGHGYPNLLSLSRSGDQLSVINLDIEHGTEVLAITEDDRLKTVQSLRHCLATDMHAFADGSCLVKAQRMAPENSDFSGEGGDILKVEAFAKYSGFDTFVVDSQFDQITPIKQGFLPRQILDGNGVATTAAIRGISHIRMGLDGEIGAVFHRKRRGIQIFDSLGEQIAYLDHPGQGMQTERVDSRGNPLVINIQADVAVNDRDEYVLVSDIVTDVFWLINFNNEIVAKAALPFPVYKIKLTPDYMYLFGRNGHFGRFYYPRNTRGERLLDPEKKIEN